MGGEVACPLASRVKTMALSAKLRLGTPFAVIACMSSRVLHPILLLSLLSACAGPTQPAVTDLGEFPSLGKADAALTVDVPFEAPAARGDEPGHGSIFTFRTCGSLGVTTDQDDPGLMRLQLVAESPFYHRRSWRGRAPHVEVPADRANGECVDYQLEVLNWGDEDSTGTLHVTTVPQSDAGVEVVFNTPDDVNQEDPSGQLRNRILDAIQSAQHTLDIAAYGLDDPAVVEAICNAAVAGVNVRVVTDDTSEDPEDSRSYYPFFFGPEGVASCGAQVEGVRSTGLMHHKFLLIDAADGDDAQLITGSTNLTTAGLDHNHNHMVFIHGAPQLFEAYQQEMDQLLRHCASQRLDGRSCDECTPSCMEDRSEEGPFMAGDVEARAYFSLSDDPLRLLRGDVRSERMDAPDPACGVGTDCICRLSGTRYSCDYCGEGADGYGLVGRASSRVAMTMYSSTDQCFALGLAHAAQRGVEVTTIWDFVKAGSRYSRDDFVAAEGVATYITNWGGGSAQVRNHNKTVVVDDTVFDGSMNLSASGVLQNNENSLVLRGAGVADVFADYVASEVALLQASGVTAQDADISRCRDLVDNDGDGLFDADDPDCDGGL